jgi:predicted amino acid racemase
MKKYKIKLLSGKKITGRGKSAADCLVRKGYGEIRAKDIRSIKRIHKTRLWIRGVHSGDFGSTIAI